MTRGKSKRTKLKLRLPKKRGSRDGRGAPTVLTCRRALYSIAFLLAFVWDKCTVWDALCSHGMPRTAIEGLVSAGGALEAV